MNSVLNVRPLVWFRTDEDSNALGLKIFGDIRRRSLLDSCALATFLRAVLIGFILRADRGRMFLSDREDS